jgi:hypothetical protein
MLAPACVSLDVAGSIRRRRPEVSDIELLAVPIMEPALDLFGQPRADAPPLNYLDALCGELRAAGVFEDRPDKNGRGAFGPRFKRLAYRGVALDLFSVIGPPYGTASWGCLMAIRTGPRWFSKALVVPENKTVYTDDGRPLCPGLMPAWLKHEGGRYVHLRDGEPISTPDEADVFKLLRLEYIPPQERDAFMDARAAAGVAR